MKNLTNFILEATAEDNASVLTAGVTELLKQASDTENSKEERASASSRLQSLRDYMDSHASGAKDPLKSYIRNKYPDSKKDKKQRGDARARQISGMLRNMAVKHGCWAELNELISPSEDSGRKKYLDSITVGTEIDLADELYKLHPEIPKKFWEEVSKEQFSGEPVIGPGEVLLMLAFNAQMKQEEPEEGENKKSRKESPITGDVRIGNRNVEIKMPGDTNAKIGNKKFSESGRVWKFFDIKETEKGLNPDGKNKISMANIGLETSQQAISHCQNDFRKRNKDLADSGNKELTLNEFLAERFDLAFSDLSIDSGLKDVFIGKLENIVLMKPDKDIARKFLKLWLCLYIILYAKSEGFDCLGLQAYKEDYSKFIFIDIDQTSGTLERLLSVPSIRCNGIRNSGMVQISLP